MLKPDHRIIEISMRICDLDTGDELAEKLWRFNPERNIDAKAYAVHGIGLDELKGKPLIKDELPNILKLLENAAVAVAHNGDYFDVPFLKMEAERNGFKFPEFYHFDTMVNGNFASELGKSPSLQELCWSMGVPYDPTLAHKGDYDTEVLKRSFFAGLRGGWYKLDEKFCKNPY
jgi:DNA polymerase-3 subunit epsilon